MLTRIKNEISMFLMEREDVVQVLVVSCGTYHYRKNFKLLFYKVFYTLYVPDAMFNQATTPKKIILTKRK